MQELVQIDGTKAKAVLKEIDSIMNRVSKTVATVEKDFVTLSFLLLETKRGAYWTLKGYKSEHEFIEKDFQQSRAQYYRLIKIARELSGYDRKLLEEAGSSKCEDLARVNRSTGKIDKDLIDHALKEDKDTFRRRVRALLDEKDKKAGHDPKVEDHFISFRIFGDGIHTVNTALETMAKTAGTDKSSGHLLELICANYNSQFADDGTGHVQGKNSFILATIQGLVEQLDFSPPDTAERLIGIVAQGVEKNSGTSQLQEQ